MLPHWDGGLVCDVCHVLYVKAEGFIWDFTRALCFDHLFFLFSFTENIQPVMPWYLFRSEFLHTLPSLFYLNGWNNEFLISFVMTVIFTRENSMSYDFWWSLLMTVSSTGVVTEILIGLTKKKKKANKCHIFYTIWSLSLKVPLYIFVTQFQKYLCSLVFSDNWITVSQLDFSNEGRGKIENGICLPSFLLPSLPPSSFFPPFTLYFSFCQRLYIVLILFNW